MQSLYNIKNLTTVSLQNSVLPVAIYVANSIQTLHALFKINEWHDEVMIMLMTT